MRNQGQVLIGIVVILFGLMILISNLFEVDVGLWCWPMALISLGIWLLLRPRFVSPDTSVQARVFGPIRRSGAWQVTNEEIWLFVGDIRLDLTQAEIPSGKTQIRVFALVGDVRLHVPEGVGVSVSSTAFVTEVNLFGKKRQSFVMTTHLSGDDYETAEYKVDLETTCLVADVKLTRA
jgi:lia operon protein LiaF